MSEPTTQAGKRLNEEWAPDYGPVDDWYAAILAIEAEARADLAARIEERVAGLPHLLPEAWLSHPDSEWLLPISAVLDAIREEAER